MIRFTPFILTLLLLPFIASTPSNVSEAQILPPYLNVDSQGQHWVDSLMTVLSPEEKIAQLFMISAYSNQGEEHAKQIENFIKKYKIGGLIMMQGIPIDHARLINRFQSASQLPLMIGFDGEWGLAMRLKNTIDYPRQMVLGAIQNDLLIYEMGREFARQMKILGIHFNFAPVVDVNINPNNPVINDRAFGENIDNIIRKSNMYIKGLQDGGILASIKHFPGHGDTDVDSHYDLPVIKHSKARLDSVEFAPYKVLTKTGVGSVMISHLHVPAIDDTPNLPATLSPKIVDSILRKEMGYKGLIFTDALNMKGITKYFSSGEAEVRALLAGNDILLFSESVPKAIAGVLAAIHSGRISQELIDEKVRKVLLAKYWLGLNKKPVLDTVNIDKRINIDYAKYLKEKLLNASMTLVSDSQNLIPIGDLSQTKIAAVHISSDSNNELTHILNNYADITHFYISKNASSNEFNRLVNRLKDFDLIISAHFDLSRFAKNNHGLTQNSIQFIKDINQNKKVINVFFGIPYTLNLLPKMNTVLIANVDDSITQSATSQIIFGAMGVSGKLPVRAGTYPVNSGITKEGGLRLRYSNPLEFNIENKEFNGIEKLIDKSIRSKATPGVQMLISYKGAIIYQKSFGYQTYDKTRAVQNTDLYDIASITKVTATAPILMMMSEQGKFDVTQPLSHYLSDLKGNKKDLIIKDILAHQSGLPAWIPFYKNTLDDNKQPKASIYHSTPDDIYSLKVTDNMYMNKHYLDTIYQEIAQSDLQSKTYRYSDLGYYYFKKIIENNYGKSLAEVTDSLVWKKLGGNKTMYNPLAHGISVNDIAPSEIDTYFRHQKIQGYVNDQGAAMMGGVAGHAGFFSNSNDLAKYFQMLLNGGKYGGVQFLQAETVKRFTTKVSANNRRAMAFDKPNLNGTDGSACSCVSEGSFGHTGFTGTIAWADPENEIIFIFLSNRTFPDPENRKLIHENYRTRIQKMIYDILNKKSSSSKVSPSSIF
ncbi:MAG: serine hydrolase [Chitinophagales bacterium]|nr:serine hydrolase [Chitinophagales bacterium]